MTIPTLRLLSLGAGRQSSALLKLSADGVLPKLDGAIFADTGWEPDTVYEHLDRLEVEVARPAGIPIYRVSNGNLRNDALDPNKMRSVPAFTMSEPYEVTVVDEWQSCPEPYCGWRALRDVRNHVVEKDGLFAPPPRILTTHGADMGGLFDSIILVPERATLTELDALASNPDCVLDSEDDGKETNAPAQVAEALRRAGLDRLPDSHAACRSTGRIATRSHAEMRRDHGMQNRKCTQQYKLRPVMEQVRLLLGGKVGEEKVCRYCAGTGERIAPWRAKRDDNVIGPCSVCEGLGTISRVGQPPAGLWAEQWIGFSADEIERVSNRGDTRYSRSRYPLLELGMSVTQCLAYLAEHGLDNVSQSACIGCPHHGNRHWRQTRDTDPKSWLDAVDFDRQYRIGAGMTHQRFLHISCKPLDQAPIDVVQPREIREGQTTIADAVYEAELAESGHPDGCSPWGCRSGLPAAGGMS
jgi:hypothetical protein